MKRTTLHLLLLLSCLLPIDVARGQGRPHPDGVAQPATTVGLGGASCDAFLLEKQPRNLLNSHHYQQIDWIEGYLTGLAHWHESEIRAYSHQDLEEWLESYCKAHSETSLMKAATAFYAQLGGRRPPTSDFERWEPVTPDHS